MTVGLVQGSAVADDGDHRCSATVFFSRARVTTHASAQRGSGSIRYPYAWSWPAMKLPSLCGCASTRTSSPFTARRCPEREGPRVMDQPGAVAASRGPRPRRSSRRVSARRAATTASSGHASSARPHRAPPTTRRRRARRPRARAPRREGGASRRRGDVARARRAGGRARRACRPRRARRPGPRGPQARPPTSSTRRTTGRARACARAVEGRGGGRGDRDDEIETRVFARRGQRRRDHL
jgi:hypothetical protein